MPCFPYRFAVLLAALFLSLPGCSYFEAETDVDDEFTEFDVNEKSEEQKDADLAEAAKTSEGELALNLKVGDRFPLKKRIEQRLTQGDGQGGTLVNRSLLEMLLSLEVEEIREGSKKLAVRYHRVHYGHNIAGRQVEYSSEQPGAAPTETLAYAGLKDNGFSFWIGPDNRVVELVGFPEFLQRCLQNVPPAYRDTVMRQLERTHSEDGLANFVDDGIGLLPYSNDPSHPAVAVKIGSTWELKPRRSEGPIATNVLTRCVLKNLNETSAEIGLLGRISGAATPVAIQEGNQFMHVLVKGGHCSGTCIIDRRTGLPTHSEVNRYMEMTVQMPDNTEIAQRKEVLTSITSFLDQGSAPGSGLRQDGSSGPLAAPAALGEDFGAGSVTPAAGFSNGFGATNAGSSSLGSSNFGGSTGSGLGAGTSASVGSGSGSPGLGAPGNGTAGSFLDSGARR